MAGAGGRSKTRLRQLALTLLRGPQSSMLTTTRPNCLYSRVYRHYAPLGSSEFYPFISSRMNVFRLLVRYGMRMLLICQKTSLSHIKGLNNSALRLR